jgi:DNA-directed RNA polymerase subunit RPC12/RpoP
MSELVSLDDFNAERLLKFLETTRENPKNGIACPECGSELADSKPFLILTSIPAKKDVHCNNCDYVGYRLT